MPDTVYITLAYGATWLVLAGYLIHLVRRTRRAEARLSAASGEASGDESRGRQQ